MKNFKIGREFQALESRIESLESFLDGHASERSRPAGLFTPANMEAGVASHSQPQLWRSEKAMLLPPFLHRMLAVPDRFMQFDLMPESKTWTCQPEPLILYITWYSGGTEEFYRLQDQTFTITRVTEPNSGQVSCSATYQARLVGTRIQSHYFAPTGDPHYQQDPGYYPLSQFRITLRNAQGGPVGLFVSPGYKIDCQENRDFIQSWSFNAGLYDLVAGATWEITGMQTVERC